MKRINRINKKKIIDVILFAVERHGNQRRQYTEEAYVVHPLRVYKILSDLTNKKNSAILQASILHDTIEDTATYFDELLARFGIETATLVQEVTNSAEERGDLNKAEYLARKMNSMSSEALLIKLADRLDNVSDAKNIQSIDKKFWGYYREQTEFILSRITTRSLSSTSHKILYKKIQKQIS